MAKEKQLKVRCPVCHKLVSWQGNAFRPFCSDRCRTRDLAAWAAEQYRIPLEKAKPDSKEE